MRGIGFLLMFGLALYTPFVAFVLSSCLYAFRFRGYELFLIGILVDSVFGSSIGIYGYLYTLGVGVVYLCVELVRPHLAWSEQDVH